MIATSKSYSEESDIRRKVADLLAAGEAVNADEVGMRMARIAKRDKMAILKIYVVRIRNDDFYTKKSIDDDRMTFVDDTDVVSIDMMNTTAKDGR